MKRTRHLNLPLYDEPHTDLFSVEDINSANQTIDDFAGDIKTLKEELYILVAPNGNRYKLIVNNNGTLGTKQLP